MEQLIPHNGNYKKLLSYQKTNTIFCLTYFFVEHFLQKGDRTYDQMLQAARSGKQNIIEGSAASTTSAKTEIKLVNVAKASLQELLEDYEDYLKTRGHRQWEEGSEELEAMRELGKKHNDAEFFMELAHTRPAETIANMCIVLIKQADYLLFRQLQRLGDDFMQKGGFSERMYRLRSNMKTKLLLFLLIGTVLLSCEKNKSTLEVKGPYANIVLLRFENPSQLNNVIVQHPIKEYDSTNGCCVYDTTSGLFLNVCQEPYVHELSLPANIALWIDQEMHIAGTSPYIHLYEDYYMIDWKWQQLMPLSALSKGWANAYHDPFVEHISEHVFMMDVSWNDINDLTVRYENSEFTQHIKNIEISRVDYYKIDQLYNDVKESDPYVCYNLSLYHDGLSVVNAYMYYTYGDCSPARRTYLTYIDYCDSLQSVYQGRLAELIRNGKLKGIGY